MNISIQQYRARIGLHNSLKFKTSKSGSQCNHGLTVIFDSLCGLAPTAAISLKYVLIIVSILNYFFDVFQEFIISNHSTSWTFETIINPKFNTAKFMDYRTIISCVLYAIIYIIQEAMQSLYKSSNCMTFCSKIYSRLFYRKSLFSCFINIYSIWLLSLNLILILLTLPNIINPGPLDELNVLYHNVEGFVNLRDKSPSPQFFTSKVNDFHGHIFHEKPDIVILNSS